MKKGLIAAIAVVVVLALMCIGSYNSLVSKETAVEEEAANIDTQLQRRADLIPNLVNTVKGYTDHEAEVFNAVTEAREKLLAAGTMSEKSAANDEVSTALSKLVAIAESYPELKSDKVYVDLMDELSGTENRISYARKSYNEAVASYNKAIKKFPGVIFANMFGFEKAEMFEAAESADSVPEVSFE
ncbi:MAG: LemA family protein [Lachnospiraceae bacterium]|nr:LemA family protein [Lachnospiraceae bacterium]